MHVKRDDVVVVVTGKDKGKQGKILSALPKHGKVIVEGVNLVSRHTKPKGQTEPGGILKQEAPIDVSNVMLYCEKCKSGVRTGMQVSENGDKIRVCKKCGDSIGK